MKERYSIINKNKGYIKAFIIVSIYFVILAPFLYTIFHAIPTSDDFCMTIDESGSLFLLSMKYAGIKWKTWSGEFIYFFLQYFINPLAYVSFESYLYGIVLCIFFLVFIAGLSYFNYSWMKHLFNIDNSLFKAIGNALIVAILLSACNYHEIFYWYVGGFYTVEYAIAYFAIGAMVRFFSVRNGEKINYILFTILGILACNAVNMCVLIGFSYLVLLLWYVKREKDCVNYSLLIPIVAYVIMGCFTVFAPGNFQRKSSFDNSNAVFIALLRAASNNIRRIIQLFDVNVVFFSFVIVFLTGLILNSIKKQEVKKVWFILPVMVVCLYGTLLPVAIGYGNSPILHNRVCFLLDAIMIPSLSIFFFWLGMYLAYRCDIKLFNKDYIIMALVMFIGFYALLIKNDGLLRCEYINQISNIRTVKQERELWMRIYSEIYNHVDSEVTIDVPDELVIRSGVLENPNLDEDPDFWINSEIRRYFRKTKIVVNMNE